MACRWLLVTEYDPSSIPNASIRDPGTVGFTGPFEQRPPSGAFSMALDSLNRIDVYS